MTGRAAPVVLAATSGTGKTTIARRLVKDSSRYVFSISATTRLPRDRETDGVDYHFLAVEDFERMAEAGQLAEWAEVHGSLYGTPRSQIDEAADGGEHVVLDIDVQGARQIRTSVPDAMLIFVLPPSIDIMMSRLRRRGTEEPAQIARRLQSALMELQAVPEFDYVVTNDNLDDCLREIREIVEGDDGEVRPPIQDAESFRADITRVLADEYSEYLKVPE